MMRASSGSEGGEGTPRALQLFEERGKGRILERKKGGSRGGGSRIPERFVDLRDEDLKKLKKHAPGWMSAVAAYRRFLWRELERDETDDEHDPWAERFADGAIGAGDIAR